MVYMTTREVAARLHVCVDTVKGWCRTGKLHGAFKLSGRAGWRIPVTAIEHLAAERRA